MSSTQHIVVAACIQKEHQILLVKRSATKLIAPGKYHLPGGHVDFGENPETALKRELQEELGVDVILIRPIFTYSYVVGEIHTVVITFLTVLSNPSLDFQLNEESDQFAWVSVNEIDQYLPEGDHDRKAIAVATMHGQ